MVAPPLEVNDDSVSEVPAVLLGVKSRMPPSFTETEAAGAEPQPPSAAPLATAMVVPAVLPVR